MKTSEIIHHKLVHALTRYDMRQSKKPSYNPHALGIYFARVDDICQDIERGAEPRAAIMAAFHGRLLDVALKGAGLNLATKDEHLNANYVYQPVTQAHESQM